MRITELIEYLSNIKEVHGNCECVVSQIKADIIISSVKAKKMNEITLIKTGCSTGYLAVSSSGGNPVVEIS